MKRAKFVLFGIGVVLAFFALASQPALIIQSNSGVYAPRTSDLYDPNDSSYYARYLPSGLTNNLTMNTTDEYDWFYVYMESNFRLTVNMNWSVPYDLDLYLYDSDLVEINSSHADRTVLFENVSYDVESAGTYYIYVEFWDSVDEVDGKGGIPLNYSLYVTYSVSTPAFEYLMIVVIVVVAFIAVLCGVRIAISQNRKKSPSQPQTTQSFRPQVQAPAPVMRYTPQPSQYQPPVQPNPIVRSESPKPGVTQRFCSMCGAQLEPGQRFCHNCGMDMEPLR